MLQNATPLRKSAPWPPNISDEHVSCTAPATENASFQILFKCPTPAIVLGNARKLNFHVLLTLTRRAIPCARHAKQHLNVQKCFVPVGVLHFWLGNVLRATSAYTFWTSQLPKAVRRWCVLCILTSKRASRHNGVRFFPTSQLAKVLWTWCVLYILTWKCASRHNGVHFFKLPKHGLRMSCFDVFCAFWLGNVLHATMACTFSTSQLPKAVRRWCVLHILTSKSSWRHNCVQFSIPHLARWLRTRRFGEPAFWPSGATNHWKNTVFHDFPTFSGTWNFFLLRLSLFDSLSSSLLFSSLLWLLPPLLFHLSILSEVWLLNFLRLYWSKSFRSKEQAGTNRVTYRSAEMLVTWAWPVPTGSSAQGGGGSFKNRKPIGRVGCCDSRMAERIHWWTERWLELCFLEWLQWLQWSPHHNRWM